MYSNKLLLNEVLGTGNDVVPIWFMRQAGRYLPEYRKIKQHNSFWDMCFNPEIMKKITIQPIERFDLDAAIIFSDILVIPKVLGLNIEFIKNIGPVFLEKDVDNRVDTIFKKSNAGYQNILKGISLIKDYTDSENKALIGFAGGPFTILAYVIEGGSFKQHHNIKKYFINNKLKFKNLIDILTDEIISFLKQQIDCGVELVQLFDSWAGILSEEDFFEYICKPSAKIVREIKNYKSEVVFIGFPKDAGLNYKTFVDFVNPDVISIDHTVPKLWAKNNLQCVIQGNLDNALLISELSDITKEVDKILRVFSDRKFVFNLGHGILPSSLIHKVEGVIDAVRSYKR